MRTICPKFFAKLYFFATMTQRGIAYFALKILMKNAQFLTFPQLFLLTRLENSRKSVI